MLREKRISKPPVPYIFGYLDHKKQAQKDARRNKNRKRCEFKMIPAPSMLSNNLKIYPLYGDIVLTENEGTISFDISLLAKFKVFRNIEITQKAATRLVQISVDPKENAKKTLWKEIVEKLESSENYKVNSYSILLRNFCTKYEDFLKDLQERGNKVHKNEQEEKDYVQITKNTELKKSQLLEFFPCLYIKSRLEESDIRITEITFNELLLRELGYTIDSFVTLVFQEGIPQFASQNSEALSCLTRTLLENYFTISPDGLVTPEGNLLLTMKNNYVRSVRAQTHFFMNYEENGFGIDTIVTVLAKGKPYLENGQLLKKVVNTANVQDLATNEKILANFLSKYYNLCPTLRYNNFTKVCTIREIPLLNDETFKNNK